MFTSFSAWALDFLSKAAGHKYIRRIPYASGGKTRYRYIYKVTHTAGGKHALHEDDVTVGAAFMLGTDKGSEVHAHVKSVNGDKVTVEYDDGPRKGEKETMSKRDLLSKLDAAHGISAALQSEREKQAKVVSELRASGASEKQIAREQARLDRLGVEAQEPEAEKPAPKKRAPKAPKATTEPSKPTQSQLAEDVEVVFNDPELLAQYAEETDTTPSIDEARLLVEAASLRTKRIKVEHDGTEKSYSVIPEMSTRGYEFFLDKGRLNVVATEGENKGREGMMQEMSKTDLVQALKDPKFQALVAKIDDAPAQNSLDSVIALRSYQIGGTAHIRTPTKNLDTNKIRALAATKQHKTIEQSASPARVAPAPVPRDQISKVDRRVLASISKGADKAGFSFDFAQVYQIDGHIACTDGHRMAFARVTGGEQGAVELGKDDKVTQLSQAAPPWATIARDFAKTASTKSPSATLTSGTRDALSAALKPFIRAHKGHYITIQTRDGQLEFSHAQSGTVLARVPQVGTAPVSVRLSPLYLHDALASDGDVSIGVSSERDAPVYFNSPHMMQVVMPLRD